MRRALPGTRLTVEFYAEPMIYVGPAGVSVLATKLEAIAFVEGILDRLRPRGFSHTTVERSFVNVSPSKTTPIS
jgi:hypothetical protein